MQTNTPQQNDEMKTHNQVESPAIGNTYSALRNPTAKKIVLGIVAVCIAALLFVLLAKAAQPGDPLYSFKTGAIEDFTGSLQVSTDGKANDQISRMETRLGEVKKLAAQETVDQKAIDALRQAILKHTDAMTALADTPEDSFPREDALIALSTFASVAAAMETISENDPELAAFGEELEDIRRDVVNLYRDKVDNFVERATLERIYAYVQARLQDVGDRLGNPDLSEETIDDAEVYIERVGPAVAESDFPRAITAIAEAQRFIEIALYVGLQDTQEPASESATTTQEETATTSEQEIETPATSSQDASFSFPQ